MYEVINVAVKIKYLHFCGCKLNQYLSKDILEHKEKYRTCDTIATQVIAHKTTNDKQQSNILKGVMSEPANVNPMYTSRLMRSNCKNALRNITTKEIVKKK